MTQYFTPDGFKKLKEKLHELKTKEMRRVVKLISEAASFGDLKENAAYHEARNMKSFLLGRIEQLQNAVNEAIIQKKTGTDKIQVGSNIVIIFDGKKENYQIVAPAEADILKSKMSYQSPLGQKLMGRGVGEEFDFEIGNPPSHKASEGRRKIKVKILEIS